jgi:acyl carrier protein
VIVMRQSNPPSDPQMRGMRERRTGDASVQQRVRNIIAQRVGIPSDTLTDEFRLVEDLGADSLVEVELVMFLEQEFDIEIPDEEFAQVKTVGDVITQVVGGLVYTD